VASALLRVAAARRSARNGLRHAHGHLDHTSPRLGGPDGDADINLLLLHDILADIAADLAVLHFAGCCVRGNRAAWVARVRGRGRNTFSDRDLNNFLHGLNDAPANINLLLLHCHLADFNRVSLLLALITDSSYRASGRSWVTAARIAATTRGARVITLKCWYIVKLSS
jgi:hypothetical protein